jgi:hypothetical protein
MTTKSSDGRQEQLFDALAFLTGHLRVASSRDEHELHALQDELARALTSDHLAATKNRSFLVESSDLYFSDRIALPQRTRLAKVTERIGKGSPEPELRVFVRS